MKNLVFPYLAIVDGDGGFFGKIFFSKFVFLFNFLTRAVFGSQVKSYACEQNNWLKWQISSFSLKKYKKSRENFKIFGKNKITVQIFGKTVVFIPKFREI